MCKCLNVDFGTYENSTGIKLPWKDEYVNVDNCILDEIKELWRMGIVTYGCCCGHNKTLSMVNVSDDDIETMLALGYRQNHKDPTRKDTFELKSVASVK